MELPKAAIVRLARKAGVKNISDECYDDIILLIKNKIKEIINIMLVVNSQQTKTLMVDDLYKSLKVMNINLAKTTNIGVNTCTK